MFFSRVLPLPGLAFAAVLLLMQPNAQAQNMAIVNGKPVPKARFDAVMANLKQQAARNGRPLPAGIEQRIKAHLIQQAIAVQQAENLKLHLTPAYAQKMDELRTSVLVEMLFEQYQKDHPITDAQIKAAYDSYIANLPPPSRNTYEYHARHILVKTEDEAKELQARLADKTASFEALATRYSIDPGSAKKGGDLGWARTQTYAQPFARALRRLKKGQISTTPVKTQFGYHIIKLEDTRPPQPPAFEMVKEQIKQPMLRQQRQDFDRYLQELQSTARIQ